MIIYLLFLQTHFIIQHFKQLNFSMGILHIFEKKHKKLYISYIESQQSFFTAPRYKQ